MSERTSALRFLESLETIIGERIESGADDSYTATLVRDGENRVAQKVGEEALELALASVNGSREEQLAEASDLVYHLLVLLASRGLSLADVANHLEKRHDA